MEESFPYPKLQRFCIFMSIIIFIILSSSTKHSSKGVVMNLVHRNKIHPIMYPPGSTLRQRMDFALSRVTGRYKMNVNTSSIPDSNQTFFHRKPVTIVQAKGSSFLAVIALGSDKTLNYVSPDTGSTLLWVQCKDYTSGHNTGQKPYDPSASTTHAPFSCLHPDCNKVPHNKCDDENRCAYSEEYADESTTSGFLVYDTLHFGTKSFLIDSPVKDVLIGCGTINHDKNKQEDGVMGLGGDPFVSIIGKTEMRFSFCLGNIYDEDYGSNTLALGGDASLIGDSEAITIKQTEYFVQMTRIMVGSREITVPNNFQVMLDSGSTFSTIDGNIYDELKSKIRKEVGLDVPVYESDDEDLDYLLCYKSHIFNTITVPDVTLKFTETVFRMNKTALFWNSPEDDAFCMAFQPAKYGGDTMLGASAMQYHNVGFDVNKSKV